jgi:HEAT repeat protein
MAALTDIPEGIRSMRKLLILGSCLLLILGCDNKSTSAWVAQLQSKDSAERLHAIKALERKKSDAATIVPALTQALDDEDPFVRRDAAKALGRFGREARSALPTLTRLLRDQNAGVRKSAEEAVKKIDPDG